jgi:glutamine---fructose-6-phosphate transaminase (isomerizing)
MLGALWSKDEARVQELKRLPQAMSATLDGCRGPAAKAAASLGTIDGLVTLARGFNLATAHEMALKLRELLRLQTMPFSAADFRHGSIALLSDRLVVALVMPSGAAFEDMASLARELRAGGAHLLVLSDDERAVDGAGFGPGSGTTQLLPIAPGPEWLSPVTAILPAQQLAVELARVQGLDPDHPRGLMEKVVRTR